MTSTSSFLLRPVYFFSLVSLFVKFVASHEHHDEELPPGQAITFDPVDGILWTHILFMSLSFGVLFPTGMVTSSSEPLLNCLGAWIIKITMARTRSSFSECSRKYLPP